MRTALERLIVPTSVSSRWRRSSPISILPIWIAVVVSGCDQTVVERVSKAHRITATTPESRDVALSRQYACQIQSERHIKIRAFQRGYLEAIEIKMGQSMKMGDLLFTIKPALSDAESAEAKLAILDYDYLKKLREDNVIYTSDGMHANAQFEEAKAKAKRAAADLEFTLVRAPFDGIVDLLIDQQGSLVEPQDVLATLSDNNMLSVYFNVPETQYLAYMASKKQNQEDLKIELILANGSKFDQPGKITVFEADFNDKTGAFPFRVDFANPDQLLPHGQTGTVVISGIKNDAIVIPQRATFEVLQKRYVLTIDNEDVAHRREIVVQNKLDDLYIIKSGVGVDDKIVLEGIGQVRDGQKLQYEIRPHEHIDANLKYHPE